MGTRNIINMKKYLYLVLLLSLKSNAEQANTNGPFFNAQPRDQPQLLAPSLLASSMIEFNGTFTPDGKEFFYTVDVPGKIRLAEGIIAHTKMAADGSWSQPKVAPFSGEFSEYDPIFSPDGQRLYYSSRRPLPDGTDNGQGNVWYVERTANGWGIPQYIKLTKQDNYYNSLTHSGVLYFNTWGDGKMYRAVKENDQYQYQELPIPLSTEQHIEGDPFVSPDEDYIIFRRSRDKGGFGKGDLYISFNIKGQWTEPENLGEPINSMANDMGPYVTTDGKLFIYASSRVDRHYPSKSGNSIKKLQKKYHSTDNGNLNIYYTSTDFITRMKAKYLKQ